MDELKMTKETIDGEPDVLQVKVSGPMTVQYMGALKDGLLQALAGTQRLSLDLSHVTVVDLSGLQLLCAAHRSSLLSSKRFDLKTGDNHVVNKASSEAGFKRHVGCIQDKDKTCLWLGGNE